MFSSIKFITAPSSPCVKLEAPANFLAGIPICLANTSIAAFGNALKVSSSSVNSKSATTSSSAC